MNERVSVKQAAKELKMAEQGIRVQMERGLLPIGYVLPSVTGSSKRYVIFRDKLDAYTGKVRECE